MIDGSAINHLLYAVCLAAVLIRNGGQSLSPVRPGRDSVTNRYPLVGVLLIRELLAVTCSFLLFLEVASSRISSICPELPLPVPSRGALSGPVPPLQTPP